MNQTSLVGRPLAALTAAMVSFAEKRGVWSGPLMSSSPELARLWAAPSTSTGVSVSEASALTYSVVWACVNNISTDVASLPLILYKNLSNGGKERLKGHKLYRILHDEPNPEQSSMTFRGMIQAHALTWGNGYAEIVRDGMGRPDALWPITPDRVTVQRNARGIFYEVARADGGLDVVPAVDMFHIQGLGYDGTVGYNLIAKAREAIALGLATQLFGGSFFGNGATFGGVISLKEQLTEQAKESYRKQMAAQHQGVDRAHRFLLLGNEASYTKLGVDPDHAQFLETRMNQIEEICRYFRMPPHKVQHLLRSTNNNIEHQGIEYYSDTLRPWCVRWEQEILRKLIAPSERMIQKAEHKIEGVLRGDLASRYAAYAIGRNWGWLSANRICELENMDPLPSGGDMFLVPMNMSPADRLNDIINAQIRPPAPPKEDKPVVEKDDEKEEAKEAERMVQMLRAALVDVEARIAEHATARATAEGNFDHTRTDNETLRTVIEAHKVAEQSAREEAARIQAVMLLAQERATQAEAERDAVRVEAAAAQEQLTTADAKLAETSTSLLAATERAQELDAERTRLQSEAAELTGRLDDLNVEHARALVELQTAAESERTSAEQCVTELRTLMTQAEQQLDTRGVELARLDTELVAAKADVDTAARELETARAQAIEDAKAVEAATAATAEAESARTLAEQATAEHATTLASEQAARAALEATLESRKTAEVERTQALLTAHRDLILDPMARLIWKETERARKNKGTPAKLKAWAESFYLLHEETCVDALRAVMRNHLVFVGSSEDVDTYTRGLIRPQLMAAVAQIRAVCDGDPEEFEVTLERLLTRWEQDRSAAIADAVFHEEMTYVRSL